MPRVRPGLPGVLCWLLGAVSARADVSLGPAEAALAIGLKAGISVGVSAPCHGASVRPDRRLQARAALDRALEASDCRAVWIDAHTVRIERRPSSPRPADEPAPPAPPTALSQVVVTASKRGLTDFDLPGSASIVGAQALAAVQARDTADLRLLASGVTLTNLGPGRDKVLLRGLSDGAFTGHTQSTVGIYWNQTPTTYNAPDPDLRLLDVQTVEVLRGPQGTLYGAGALGGVLSITPNAPEAGGWAGSLSASAATTASGAPSAAMEGVLNAPLLQGRAAARLVAYEEDDGGYIALPRLGVEHANHVQETGLRAAFKTEPVDGWDVTLGDIYQDIYSDDTQYTTGDPDALQRDTAVREPHDNDFEQAYLAIHGHGGWGELRGESSFIDHDFQSRYDASQALPIFGGGAGAGAYDDETLIRLASQELDYRAPWKGPLSLLLGGYGGYGDEHEQTALGPLAGAPLYGEDRTDRLTDLALFGEAAYALSPRWTVTVGLRLAYAGRRTLSRVTEGAAATNFGGDSTARETSPKLALDYALHRGVRLYALASRGYRIGGFNTAGPLSTAFTTPGGVQPNRAYQPDLLWNYELGAKLEGWGGRLEGRTAIYYDVWHNLQADQFLPSGLPYVANVGEARVAGWEWEASARPIPPLTLAAGALFTVPELHTVDPSFPTGRSDFTLPGVPRRSLDARLGYEIPLGRGRTLSFDLAAAYVGHAYLFFGPQGSSEMGQYLDARLQGALRTPHYALALMIANPANSRGDTFAFGNPFTLGGPSQATPQRPRTLRLTLTRAF